MHNKDEFLENIKRGAWNVVLKQLHQSGVRLPKRILQNLYSQLIKELLLEKEYHIAQLLLKEQSVLLSEAVLSVDGQKVIQNEGHLLQDLWDLAQQREPPHTLQSLFKGTSLKETRETLGKEIEESLSKDTIPPNRLLQLLTLGLEYERLIKSGKSLLTLPYSINGAAESGGDLEMSEANAVPYVQKISSHKLFTGDFKIQTIAISHNIKYLALGGQDGLIEVWDYNHLTLDLSLPYQANDLYMLHRQSVLSLVYSQDDKILASGDAEGIIRVWKFADGKKLREIDTQGGEGCGIASMILTANNSQLIAGCLDKSIRVYGLKSGNLLKILKGHDSFIQRIQLIPQKEHILISSAEDGMIIQWNLAEADPKSQLVKHIETPAQKLQRDMLLNNFQVNPHNQNELLICHRYRSCYLVSVNSCQVLQEYATNQSRDEELLFACFNTEASHVYAYSTTKNLYIFDKKSGKLVSLLLVPASKPEILGMIVAAASQKQRESMVIYANAELFKLESREQS